MQQHLDLETGLRLHLGVRTRKRWPVGQGRFELFRNYDEYGDRLARPRTLLIDSEQLESGDALDKEFRTMAADEIERFRRDLVQRTGDQCAGEKISAQDLLREVMNTDRKSTRLNSSHSQISYAVFCLKKKK